MLDTVDCFGYRLAMTIGISCHVERSETSLCDSILCIFRQGGQGGYLRSVPLSPLTIPQTPSRLLNVRCTCICHSPQRMRQRYAYGSNIAAVRCGWDVKIKEQWRIKNCNLQSAAVLWLRHSFARAFYWGLFALLLGILCSLIASLRSQRQEIRYDSSALRA